MRSLVWCCDVEKEVDFDGIRCSAPQNHLMPPEPNPDAKRRCLYNKAERLRYCRVRRPRISRSCEPMRIIRLWQSSGTLHDRVISKSRHCPAEGICCRLRKESKGGASPRAACSWLHGDMITKNMISERLSDDAETQKPWPNDPPRTEGGERILAVQVQRHV